MAARSGTTSGIETVWIYCEYWPLRTTRQTTGYWRSILEKIRLHFSKEEERWQISRYIHDTIVQNLSLSSMRLANARKTLLSSGRNQEDEYLRSTRDLIETAIAECRNVMSELTPSLLYELGLVPALTEMAETLQQRHGTRISITDSGPSIPMENALRGMLYQTTRELVMNAIKHAGPCVINVNVTTSENSILIQVQDNGRGFDVARLDDHHPNNEGFGLFSARERIESLNGCLEIKSTPGQGTTSRISLPVKG